MTDAWFRTRRRNWWFYVDFLDITDCRGRIPGQRPGKRRVRFEDRSKNDPLEILKKRYARSEIDDDKYERGRKKLEQ